MKLESLQQKRHEIEKQMESLSRLSKNKSFGEGYQKGVDTSFKTFISLITQYEKYKGEVKLLMEEQNTLWKEWVQFYEKQTDIPQSEYLQHYNSWLFNFLFHHKNNDFVETNSLFHI